MNKQISNPCTRCGKERVDVKTWVEESSTFFGTSTITHTETACPDPECQDIVDQKNQLQKEKKEHMELERQERLKRSHRNRKQA